MKYLEELKAGDVFAYQNQKFLLTNDFKHGKNEQIRHGAVSLNDGSARWFEANIIVQLVDLYYQDTEGNILLLKEYKDEDSIYQNKNVH